MPKALYTPAVRAEVVAVDLFMAATRLPSDPAEDRFQLGDCRVSCRYWTAGGDVVSRQILGCANAIRHGRLRSADKDAAVAQVFKAKTEIGIVGLDEAVAKIARDLAAKFGRILISPTDAELVR